MKTEAAPGVYCHRSFWHLVDFDGTFRRSGDRREAIHFAMKIFDDDLPAATLRLQRLKPIPNVVEIPSRLSFDAIVAEHRLAASFDEFRAAYSLTSLLRRSTIDPSRTVADYARDIGHVLGTSISPESCEAALIHCGFKIQDARTNVLWNFAAESVFNKIRLARLNT